MPSTPSSPTSRRRRSTNISNSSVPRSTHATPTSSPTHSRQTSSQQSSPVYRRTSRSFINHDGAALDLSLSQQRTPIAGEGLGESLADELANAWEEDEEGERQDEEEQDMSPLSRSTSTQGLDGLRDARNGTQLGRKLDESALSRDEDPVTYQNSTVEYRGGAGHSHINGTPNTTFARQKHSRTRPRGHTRKQSRYDGSEYGDLSDSEHSLSSDLPSGLKVTIADVDMLVREHNDQNPRSHQQQQQKHNQSSNDYDPSEIQDPVQRLLKNLNTSLLASQSALETKTTRLITAHTSLSTHLAYQTRSLHASTYPLLSPLSAPPTSDVIADLLPLITASLAAIPQPTFTTLHTLSQFSTAGRDVVATLGVLSDSLHMARQVEGEAGRRLKSARDMVGEMRRECEAGEVGKRWIEAGGWEERLRGRECARECKEVVGGFEEVCNGLRERIVKGAEGVRAVG